MAQSDPLAAGSSSDGSSPVRRIEVVEIVDVTFAEDCGHIDFAVRADSGSVVLLRTPRAAIAAAFARLSHRATMELEMSTDERAAKLSAPIGQWEVVQSVGGAIPTFECRVPDGRGVAVGIAYDPITAIPRLQVAVDL